MIQPEQLQQDIAALPEAAQVLVADFVAFLKQRYTAPLRHPMPPQRSRILSRYTPNPAPTLGSRALKVQVLHPAFGN